MWRSRDKSSPKFQRHKNFSFSSFKDIESLCSDNFNNSDPYPNPLKPSKTTKASIFHRVLRTNTLLRAFATPPRPLALTSRAESEPLTPLRYEKADKSEPPISIPGAEKRIVIYLTSLHVVRSTFEACRTVQSILSGFRVTVEERDLSMDSSFMEELQKILNISERTKLTLPRVFIGGRYIGGEEEVRQLNETGELKKLVEGLQAAEQGVCVECGGYRFILCEACSGSHKCYKEKSSRFKSCTACNENGLIRCPSCSLGSISSTV